MQLSHLFPLSMLFSSWSRQYRQPKLIQDFAKSLKQSERNLPLSSLEGVIDFAEVA